MALPKNLRRPARAIMLDGPGTGLAISRKLDQGARIVVRVQADGRTRLAEYESVGACSEVPPADGVGLRFVGFADEQQPTKKEKRPV